MFESLTVDEICKLYEASVNQVNDQITNLDLTCGPTLGQINALRNSLLDVYTELDFQLSILHELNNTFTNDMIGAKIGETILTGKLISEQTGLPWPSLSHWSAILTVDGV